MRASTIVMIGFAVVFGLLAVFIAQVWLNNQANMQAMNYEANKKPLSTRTIVVAKEPLRFGTELAATMLQEVPWPVESLPSGAFTAIKDILSGGRRVVLSAIEANEPVLALKITGAGQRATLSALVKPGMKAVTIRVNDVEGVGGFVLPGDHVDVVLTRQIEKGSATTDVVLQNTRVLAIDQTADERTDKPAIARAVTLEVEVGSAQKLALASSVGTLSLMLRRAGEATSEQSRRVTIGDLLGSSAPAAPESRFATIGVRRAGKRDDVSVPMEDSDATVGAAVRGHGRN